MNIYMLVVELNVQVHITPGRERYEEIKYKKGKFSNVVPYTENTK